MSVRVVKNDDGRVYVFNDQRRLATVGRQVNPRAIVRDGSWFVIWFDGELVRVMQFRPETNGGMVFSYDTAAKTGEKGELQAQNSSDLVSYILPLGDEIPAFAVAVSCDQRTTESKLVVRIAGNSLEVEHEKATIFFADNFSQMPPQRICNSPWYWRFWQVKGTLYALEMHTSCLGPGLSAVLHQFDLTGSGRLRGTAMTLTQAFKAGIPFPNADVVYPD